MRVVDSQWAWIAHAIKADQVRPLMIGQLVGAVWCFRAPSNIAFFYKAHDFQYKYSPIISVEKYEEQIQINKDVIND